MTLRILFVHSTLSAALSAFKITALWAEGQGTIKSASGSQHGIYKFGTLMKRLLGHLNIFFIGIQYLKYQNIYVTLPFKTVLYGTLLVILNTRLDPFPESGPLAFLSFELFEGVGSSSSATSSMLQSCKHFDSQRGHSDNQQYYMPKSLLTSR